MNDSGNQREQCAVCGKDVTDVWFARLRRGNEWVKVCSSKCALRYFDSVRPADLAGGQSFESRDGRCHFFVNGECWS